MNWLDVVIVFGVAWFTATAFMAGLIRELVTLVATFLAIAVAGLYYDDLATDVLVFINSTDIARAVSFLVLLGSVFFMGQLAAYFLRRTVSLLMLGWADHLAGAVFGFLKGILIVEILLILFVTYPQLNLDEVIDGSALAPFFLEVFPFLLKILPGEFEARVDAFLA